METELGIKVEGSFIRIDEINNMHIKSVTLESGNDDYETTSDMTIVSSMDSLAIDSFRKFAVGRRPKSESRYRGEPAVILNCEDEEDNRFRIIISHHKGGIMVKAEKELAIEIL